MNPIDILILDYKKSEESLILLKSIKEFCNFPNRVVFLDNGSNQDYPREFKDAGLIDELISLPKNEGLGIGTRELFAAAKSEFIFYIQNDQYFNKIIDEKYIDFLKVGYNGVDSEGNRIKSISLAGENCGLNVYSERAHFIKTDFYLEMEKTIPLSEGGAGPKAHLIWREEQIQNYYKENKYIHFTQIHPVIIDNGKRAIRENPDGSKYIHLPDSKELKVLVYPTEKYVYPKWTDLEWEQVLKTKNWPDWQIPQSEIAHSFKVPQWHS